MRKIIFSTRIEKLTHELDEAKKNLQEKEDNEKQLKGMKYPFPDLRSIISFRNGQKIGKIRCTLRERMSFLEILIRRC